MSDDSIFNLFEAIDNVIMFDLNSNSIAIVGCTNYLCQMIALLCSNIKANHVTVLPERKANLIKCFESFKAEVQDNQNRYLLPGSGFYTVSIDCDTLMKLIEDINTTD